MFNVKVFRAKDLIKYFIILILVVLIIYFISKIFIQNKELKDISENKKTGFLDYNLTACIETTSTIVKDMNKPKEIEKKAYKSNLFEEVLKSQISLMEDTEEDKEVISIANVSNDGNNGKNLVNNNESQDENKEQTLSLATTGLQTEVITNNPLTLNFNREYGNVKIKNETSYELTDEMLNPNINISNKNILLFHTHTCESYTSSEKYNYEPTGNFRTTDLNFSVARVGDEFTNQLKSYGYNVIHDTTYHDYPAYNGSYTRSLETVSNILKSNEADIIFDVHRDAIGSRSDYAPCVKIGDDVAAQIMFVIGTNEGGLWHPNWNQNLKFAIKVQEKAEEMYPGLFKPITLTKYRYNQHVGKYASIIEVGATGNTLEQCLNSMKYLAKVLDEVLK